MSTRDLSEGLRARVTASGMTQAAVGARAGMSQPQFFQILSGKIEPKVSTALRIARALECPVEDLWALPAPVEAARG